MYFLVIKIEAWHVRHGDMPCTEFLFFPCSSFCTRDEHKGQDLTRRLPMILRSIEVWWIKPICWFPGTMLFTHGSFCHLCHLSNGERHCLMCHFPLQKNKMSERENLKTSRNRPKWQLILATKKKRCPSAIRKMRVNRGMPATGSKFAVQVFGPFCQKFAPCSMAAVRDYMPRVICAPASAVLQPVRLFFADLQFRAPKTRLATCLEELKKVRSLPRFCTQASPSALTSNTAPAQDDAAVWRCCRLFFRPGPVICLCLQIYLLRGPPLICSHPTGKCTAKLSGYWILSHQIFILMWIYSWDS